MLRALDVTTSTTASFLRLGAGFIASHAGPRPTKLVELYEFEGCPFCRKVREALTMLDLDAKIFPCPKGGPSYRPRVSTASGKTQFPFLVDPNTGVQLHESADIIRHLYRHYGSRRAPWWLAADITLPLGSLATLVRAQRGIRYRPAKKPAQPLELWSFEASPYCRIVRETLCELELPHVLHNVGKRSAQRAAFRERSGRMLVPWLSDPNTGRELFESAEIKRYLIAEYANH